MAITQVTKNMAIISALADLPNATDGLTPAQLKAKFDEGGEALKTYINSTLIPALQSVVDGSSGADQIGATAIEGLTGETVQALLEALKTLVDTKSNTTDIYTRTALNNGQLDTRYFTETELQSTTDSNSGADKVGATPISTSPSTVQGILEWLKAQIDNTTLGQIPDGSVTPAKLSFDPATQTELDTTNQDVTNLSTNFNAHLAHDVHLQTGEREKWNSQENIMRDLEISLWMGV